jgi:hypothetical protein
MTGRVILALLAVLLGVVAGLGALIGTATITERPPLFLLAGLLTTGLVDEEDALEMVRELAYGLAKKAYRIEEEPVRFAR